MKLNKNRHWRWNYKKPVALIITVLVIFFGYMNLNSSEAEGLNTKEIVVQSGESLWQLANESADPKQDIREFVEEIIQLNDLKSSQIAAGQLLRIPVR